MANNSLIRLYDVKAVMEPVWEIQYFIVFDHELAEKEGILSVQS